MQVRFCQDEGARGAEFLHDEGVGGCLEGLEREAARGRGHVGGAVGVFEDEGDAVERWEVFSTVFVEEFSRLRVLLASNVQGMRVDGDEGFQDRVVSGYPRQIGGRDFGACCLSGLQGFVEAGDGEFADVKR